MSRRTSNRKNSNSLPKVIYVKLGRTKPERLKDGYSRTDFGQWQKGLIKIDPRQNAQEMLDTIVHEVLHEALEELTEEGVERVSGMLSAVLWREGYRKTSEGKERA